VGEGPEGSLDVVDGRLISVYWWTAEDVRRRLMNPESALLPVGSWRDGVLIHDPTGVGAEVQQEARDWSWEKIEREADEWVADKLVMWAEYLPKLAGALEGGRLLDCAALRSRITLQLAELFAVHRRLIEASENGFWRPWRKPAVTSGARRSSVRSAARSARPTQPQEPSSSSSCWQTMSRLCSTTGRKASSITRSPLALGPKGMR
jgi:hypothetical protein